MPTRPVAVLVALAALLLVAGPAQAASTPQPRIINGEPAPPGDYPWTVALVDPTADPTDPADPGDPTRPFCGGTLIQPTVVLTAAHCVTGFPAATVGIVAGLTDLSALDPATFESSPHFFEVTQVSVHPDAEVSDDDLAPRRDLALLTLDGDATLPAAGAEVVPVAAPGVLDTAVAASDEVVASGWGLTATGIDADVVDDLQFVTLDLVPDATCAARYQPFVGHLSFSPADQLCAIRGTADAPDEVADTCNGDSGGPLVLPTDLAANPQDPADWALVGTTSWGIDCAYVDDNGTPDDPSDDQVIPGVYARTADEQLFPYVNDVLTDGDDDHLPQPEWTPAADEEPLIGTDDPDDPSFITCVGNPLTWSGGVDQVDYLVRRVTDDGLETVSTLGSYEFDEGDAGDDFLCEVHGRRTGAGGYGLARSATLRVGPAEPQVVTNTVTVPGPTVVVQGPPLVVPLPVPVAPPADGTAPRITKVTRSCTRRRVCTFTVTATDVGSGVKGIAAQITRLTTRSCRRGGRRTRCASSSTTLLRARAVAGRRGVFRIRTRTLRRGAHTLQLRAVDAAGNVQDGARRLSFTLR